MGAPLSGEKRRGRERRPLIRRTRVLLLMAVLVPVGIGTKYYGGPMNVWVTRYGGDVASPMFFFFLVLLIRPAIPLRLCALAVFLFCVLVEFSQLHAGPSLDAVRRSLIGMSVLGSEFDWRDFIFYAVGIAFSLALCRPLSRGWTKVRA